VGNGISKLANSLVRVTADLKFDAAYTDPKSGCLNGGDTDLGSGGPLLLPGDRIIGGGKEGVLHLLDRTGMKLQQSFQASWDTYHLEGEHAAPCNPGHGCSYISNKSIGKDCFIPKSEYSHAEMTGPNIHGNASFFQSSPTRGMIYLLAEKDYLRGFEYDVAGGKILCDVSSPAGECYPKVKSRTVRSPDGMPGGFTSVSSNGASNGIVWSINSNVDGQGVDNAGVSESVHMKVYGRLVASDAMTLAELYRDDSNVPFVRFMPPVVADGLVFRGTMSSVDTQVSPQSELIVYGLLTRGK
jgi:hypothetical protein